jgi:fengycin family lipopeptide synthetase D
MKSDNNLLITSSEYRLHTKFWKARLNSLTDDHESVSAGGIRSTSPYKVKFSLAEVDPVINEISGGSALAAFVIVLSGIQYLLSWYSGRKTLAIDTPFLKKVSSQKGNKGRVPLIELVDGRLTVRDFVNRVKQSVADSYAYQDYPIEALHAAITQQPTSNLLSDVRVYCPLIHEAPESDLTYSLDISISRDIETTVKIESDGVMLEDHTISLLGSHLIKFISAIRDSAIRLSELQFVLFEEYETRTCAEDWLVQRGENTTVISAFDNMVRERGEHPAVFFGERSLSFLQVRDMSMRLAAYLVVAISVKKGDVICVLAERSAFTVPVILGIMRAGGVYMPISPETPVARIQHMIGQSSAAAILFSDGTEHLSMQLQSPSSLVINDNFFARVQDLAFRAQSLQSSDLAYIIFTSGSTGVPKGVIIEHDGLLHRALYYRDKFNISAKDKVLQFLSLAFDGSILDIFSALVSGATLIMPEGHDIFNTDRFVECIEQHKVTLFVVTPSYLSLLKHHPLPTVRLIVSAGEPVKLNDAYFYAQTKEFYNAYGPSEASIVATIYKIDKDNITIPAPIGKCVPEVQVYIMDKAMRLMPPGVIGELCIGGVGIAKGYLNEPGLTGQKFVSNPFRRGKMLYKTGDIGKWTNEGNILFIGRNDEQIKLNGLRIDLAEIRSVFVMNGRVDDAEITFENGKNIVCFFTFSSNTINGKDVVAHLRTVAQANLPHYMIPSRFIQLGELPRTTNDKVDKEVLRNLYLAQESDHRIFVPGNSAEQYLADIWLSLLGKPVSSKSDSFFELGGNSLIATQLISKIDRDLNIQVRIRDIFEYPEFGDFAALVLTFGKSPQESISSAGVHEYYDLSHAQKRLWIVDQLNLAGSGYSIMEAFSLHGRVNVAAIDKAFQVIVQRHESLRTVFKLVNGEPKQKILDFNPDQHCVRLTDLEGQDDVEGIVQQEIANPGMSTFDLGNGPLIRVKLVKLATDRYLLILSLHHIISDGWSMKVLAKEFFDLYNNIDRERSYNLKPLTIQYKDFAAWQNSKGTSAELEAYWLNKFSGELITTKLPCVYKRTSPNRGELGSVTSILDRDTYVRLRDIAKQNNASLFMVMLSAINVFLYKYTSNTDLILGTVISGRNNIDLENQIGYYLSTLPIRTSLSSKENFLELLQNVRQSVLEAYEFQSYPFDKLIDKLDLRREAGSSPLFEILVDFHTSEIEVSEQSLGDARMVPVRVSPGTSKYDITIGLLQIGDKLNVVFEFDKSLFSRASVELFVSQFNNVITTVSAKPTIPLRTVSMLDMSDKLQLLKYAKGPSNILSDTTIVTLFEAQALKNADNVALSFGGEDMTYEQLNQKANQLAHYLVNECHVERGDIAGLMCDRSLKCVIAFLGIMKAGAAFLPIDASYPNQRKQYLLSDSRVKVLLTESAYLFDLDYYEGRVFAMDVQLPELSTSDKNLSLPYHGSDSAYVIYTSGSTGLPKGVEVLHESFVNYITWSNRFYFNDTTGHVFGLFTSLSFDLTLTSIFTTLLRGDRLVIYSNHMDVGDILTDMFDSRSLVNAVKLTPSHISLLNHLPIGTTNVKDVVVGGEAFTAEQFKILKRLNSDVKVYNEYGPTEATVGCMVKEIVDNDDITIGTPIDNMCIYIMDQDQNLVPVGVGGEIGIGGVGVARGYLNNPELTLSKFIADPFIEETQSRIYLTGDRGKWLPSGEVEYLGRKDAQIKIRGHRIEPGEIESIIVRHEDVRQAFVYAMQENNGSVLVAALTLDGMRLERMTSDLDHNKIIEEVKALCVLNLPSVAIPVAFFILDKFPLTLNGKIDTEALDRIELDRQVQNYFMEPSNSVEEKILNVWREVLGKDTIGITSNFFDLGGDSLKAVQISAMLYREMGIHLKLSFLFDYPTIQQLAEIIQERAAANIDFLDTQTKEVII